MARLIEQPIKYFLTEACLHTALLVTSRPPRHTRDELDWCKEKGDCIAAAIKEHLESGSNLEAFRRDEDTRLRTY